MNEIGNKNSALAYLILFLSFILFLYYFLFVASFQEGGDIIEYYGVTESLVNHKNIWLSEQDKQNLSDTFNPGYFDLPGYYLEGVGGRRYPVHFVFYSFLILPIRLILRILGLSELKSMMVFNVLFLFFSLFLIFKFFVKKNRERFSLLILTLFSPLIFFFIWPGPDIYYMCLVLLALFCFFNKKYIWSIILTILASWHSQPLVILAGGMILWYLIDESKILKKHDKEYWEFDVKKILISFLLSLLVFIPYIYNIFVFGVFTPWTILKDGWTEINGFGLQNASIKKTMEIVFDLNIGIFWYAPIYVILGGAKWIRECLKSKKPTFLSVFVLLTLIFYQTNPAWHYGTAGFGPSRHGIILLVLFIYFSYRFIKEIKKRKFFFLSILITLQFFSLSMNKWLEPDLTKVHHHNFYASWVLDNYPRLYNPNPEIFVDRTNNNDLSYPSAAIYKKDGFCKKAFVFYKDWDWLENECSNLNPRYENLVKDRINNIEGIYVDF